MKGKLALFLLLVSCVAYSKTTVVNVYYFHTNFRCPTCTKMEAYTREAIDTNFKKEIASGLINFKTVNMEEKKNEHFIKDYQLYTKTVILSKTEDGKQIKYKNLDKIWEYSRNKNKFLNYVKDEVSKYLITN